jgi:small redox-active disulfide protein 2
MLVLEVYGTGCAKCNRLEANADAAAKSLGLDYRLEKITDPDAITDAGVLITPALVVNGTIVVSGKAPAAEEIAALLPEG